MGSRRRWVGQLAALPSTSGVGTLTVAQYDKVNPPGYLADWDVVTSASSPNKAGKKPREITPEWKEARAWETAQAPMKNFLMMGFMMWMAGSNLNLFSIGILFSLFWQPFSALRSVNATFKPFEDEKADILGPKLVFTALNLVAFGLGLWKLNTMGLLPTTLSDWISQLPPRPLHSLTFLN